MLSSFISAVTKAPSFRKQMKVVVQAVKQGQLAQILDGIEKENLGKALGPTVSALEILRPYLAQPLAQWGVASNLSADFYAKTNIHPKTTDEIKPFQEDPVLIDQTDRVIERLVSEKGVPREVASEFKRVMLKYPRAAFMADFHAPEHVYSNDPITMTSNEQIGGYDYQVSVLTALDLKPGQQVLHIGAGTAWPDALIADLIGPEGKLTSFDIKDPLIVAARRRFQLFGLTNTEHLVANALEYDLEGQTFDRILFSIFLPGGMVPRRYVHALNTNGIVQHPTAMKDNKAITYQQIVRKHPGGATIRDIESFELDPDISDLLAD